MSSQEPAFDRVRDILTPAMNELQELVSECTVVAEDAQRALDALAGVIDAGRPGTGKKAKRGRGRPRKATRSTAAVRKSTTVESKSKINDLLAKLREVIAGSDAPLTTKEIAERAGLPNAQGLHAVLTAMKKRSELAEVEPGEWLRADHPRFGRPKTGEQR